MFDFQCWTKQEQPGEVRVIIEKESQQRSSLRFRRTLSVSVPNLCLSCDEERKSSAKTVKNLKEKRIIEDLENGEEKIEEVDAEHQLTE